MPELQVMTRALHHNIRLVRREAGGATVIGVVKGNGYGLGLMELARELVDYGIRWLAVSELSEGLQLREQGIDARIMLLSPIYGAAELEQALAAELVLCIDSVAGAKAASAAAARLGRVGRGQLCVDTGFGRYGFGWDRPWEVYRAVQALEGVSIVGTYSHLSCAGVKDSKVSRLQYERFMKLCEELDSIGVRTGMRHLADSYAMLLYPEMRLDGVRIGSAFLGRLPFPDRWGFERIGALSASVREVRTLSGGSTVGYGGATVTRGRTQIAVVDAGYFHGFGMGRTQAPPKSRIHAAAYSLFRRRKKAPERPAAVMGPSSLTVLGPVGMCATVLDVTGIEVKVGDQVSLTVNPLFVSPVVPRRYI